jgi:hypothetical protein
MLATFPAHLILLDFIIPIIFGDSVSNSQKRLYSMELVGWFAGWLVT